MNILIVNYYYPPLVDAHAYRWAQLGSWWVERGHNVDVITGLVDGAEKQSVEQGVHVNRCGLISRPRTPTAATGKSLKKMSFRALITDFIRPIYRKLYWPDASWHWFPYLASKLWRERKKHYDMVISYYPCMAAHMAVAALRKISSHPDFIWIADYGDPFSTSDTMPPNNYALYKAINVSLERRIWSAADCLVFTNEATAEAYGKLLGIKHKSAVIPHLVDMRELRVEKRCKKACCSDEITLCFVGGFHKGIREPQRLFSLVQQLNALPGPRIALDIYGPLNNFKFDELRPAGRDDIRYHGPVTRENAQLLLKNADIIVNVDNENCIMTPSKIVECIATGRPLLNITNPEVEYPPMQSYEKLGYALSVTNVEPTQSELVEVRHFFEKMAFVTAAPASGISAALGAHEIAAIAQQYENIEKQKG